MKKKKRIVMRKVRRTKSGRMRKISKNKDREVYSERE